MDSNDSGVGVVIGIIVVIFFGWLFFSGSDSSSSTYESGDSYDSSVVEEDYESVDEEPNEFYGYECTDDCSGHVAGYDWAEENDVCDEYFDGSNSESFDEGVRAYTEENC